MGQFDQETLALHGIVGKTSILFSDGNRNGSVFKTDEVCDTGGYFNYFFHFNKCFQLVPTIALLGRISYKSTKKNCFRLEKVD